MKVTILTGSPHRRGATAALADKVQEGARDAGCEVVRFNVGQMDIRPCRGCDASGCGARPCVIEDDMARIYEALATADAVVWASPVYYHAFSAQLKCAIDRIHGIDDLVRGRGKLLYTVVVGASPADWIFDGVRATVATSARYLGWRDCGGLYANGCQSREDLEGKGWLDDAYDLGMSIAKRQASSLESNLSKGL